MATSSHGEQLNPDLQRMWVSVQVQFTKAAGKEFDAKKMLSIEDVVKQILPRTDSPKVQKAKDVFSKILTCIQRLGAIASQGASMVGPRSS
jgi:fungal STAND N-terminal Goodbye domain